MPVQHQDELLPLLLQLLDLGFQLCVHEFQPLRFLCKNREMWLLSNGERLCLWVGTRPAFACFLSARFPLQEAQNLLLIPPSAPPPHIHRVTDFLQEVSFTPVTLACVTSGINPSHTRGPAKIMSHLSPLAHSTPATVAPCCCSNVPNTLLL